MGDENDDCEEIKLSDADAATLASIETPPEVQALWAARDEAARAHDWPKFWQTYIDTSQRRTEFLTGLGGYPTLLAEEERIRARYVERRILTFLGLWPEPGEDLPRGYVYDPACSCDVCVTLRGRGYNAEPS